MEKTVSCRNVGLWRNLVNVTVENMVIQMYPCGFINMLKGVPNYHTHLYHEMFYVRQGDTDILTTEKIYKFHPPDFRISARSILPIIRRCPMTCALQFAVQQGNTRLQRICTALSEICLKAPETSSGFPTAATCGTCARPSTAKI